MKSFDKHNAYTQNPPAGYSILRKYPSGSGAVRLAALSFGFLVFLEQVESITLLPYLKVSDADGIH